MRGVVVVVFVVGVLLLWPVVGLVLWTFCEGVEGG